MHEFIYKKGSEIASFESKNIHTASSHIIFIEKFPCQIITKIKEKVYNTLINSEELIEKTLVWNVDPNGKLISRKGN